MSVHKVLSLFCDGDDGRCPMWFGHEPDDTPALRRIGYHNGWTRRRVDGRLLDLCPTCSAKRAKEARCAP